MLKPWVQGPLYLADGTGRYPLGWSKLEIHIHQQTTNVPVVVLPTPCLALPVVLGLDFVCLSGLQFVVSENMYWLKTASKRKYYFLKEEMTHERIPLHSQIAFYSAGNEAPHR